jgi:hypothetical protein
VARTNRRPANPGCAIESTVVVGGDRLETSATPSHATPTLIARTPGSSPPVCAVVGLCSFQPGIADVLPASHLDCRQVRLFEGGVSDYEAFRRNELGTAADRPHRIRCKRLVA